MLFHVRTHFCFFAISRLICILSHVFHLVYDNVIVQGVLLRFLVDHGHFRYNISRHRILLTCQFIGSIRPAHKLIVGVVVLVDEEGARRRVRHRAFPIIARAFRVRVARTGQILPIKHGIARLPGCLGVVMVPTAVVLVGSTFR